LGLRAKNPPHLGVCFKGGDSFFPFPPPRMKPPIFPRKKGLFSDPGKVLVCSGAVSGSLHPSFGVGPKVALPTVNLCVGGKKNVSEEGNGCLLVHLIKRDSGGGGAYPPPPTNLLRFSFWTYSDAPVFF